MKIRLKFRKELKVDIRYRTKTEVTQRTIEASEAFGLGVEDERTFIIADNVDIDVKEGDIVYITGDSGSGKSSILRVFEKHYGDKAVNIDKIEIDKDRPLIDTVGKTVVQGFMLLSRVGLGDAFLFIDEDLNPTVRVDKRFGSEIRIHYNDDKSVKECSLVREMVLAEGTYADWKKLSVFHYRSHRTPPQRKIFIIKRSTGYKQEDDELCGIVVYSYPPIVTFGRRQAFGKVVKQPELNQKISIISRVVVHPKYRSIGLGQKLIRETLNSCPTEYAETIAVMAKYNPFFEKAGMQKVMEKIPSKTLTNAVQELERLGFDSRFIGSEAYNLRLLEGKDLAVFRRIFAKNYHPRYGKMIPYLNKKTTGLAVKSEFAKQVQKFDAVKIAKLIRLLAIMSQVSVYLIWWKGGKVEFDTPDKPKSYDCPKCGVKMVKIKKGYYCPKVGCKGHG